MTAVWGDQFTSAYKPWTSEELAQVQRMIAQKLPFSTMAATLGRSQESIRLKARKAGFTGERRSRK
jgi:hypothetical protein